MQSLRAVSHGHVIFDDQLYLEKSWANLRFPHVLVIAIYASFCMRTTDSSYFLTDRMMLTSQVTFPSPNFLRISVTSTVSYGFLHKYSIDLNNLFFSSAKDIN